MNDFYDSHEQAFIENIIVEIRRETVSRKSMEFVNAMENALQRFGRLTSAQFDALMRIHERTTK